MLNELLYVVAGRYDQAKAFADCRGVPISKLRYVDAPEKIKGLRGIKLHVHSSALDRKDFGDILQEARIRGFEIVDV